MTAAKKKTEPLLDGQLAQLQDRVQTIETLFKEDVSPEMLEEFKKAKAEAELYSRMLKKEADRID